MRERRITRDGLTISMIVLANGTVSVSCRGPVIGRDGSKPPPPYNVPQSFVYAGSGRIFNASQWFGSIDSRIERAIDSVIRQYTREPRVRETVNEALAAIERIQ